MEKMDRARFQEQSRQGRKKLIAGMTSRHFKATFFSILWLFLFCMVPIALAAQPQSTAGEIETLLASQAVTYAQASRFVLEAAGAAVLNNPMEAFRFAMERNWLPRNAIADDPARLDGVSLLFMRSFGMRGGIFFTLRGSPRSAYREMEYMGILPGRTIPNQRVSGDTLLYLTSRVLARGGEDAVLAAELATMAAEAGAERHLATELEVLAAQIYLHLEELKLDDVYVIVAEEGIIIRLSDIQFLADSAEIPDDEREKIDEIAEILRGVLARELRIAGHTALAGTAEGQLIVSTERAQAVADHLVYLGVREAHEISIAGYGADRPVADNDTQEGMAANRRVEIIILGN